MIQKNVKNTSSNGSVPQVRQRLAIPAEIVAWARRMVKPEGGHSKGGCHPFLGGGVCYESPSIL